MVAYIIWLWKHICVGWLSSCEMWTHQCTVIAFCSSSREIRLYPLAFISLLYSLYLFLSPFLSPSCNSIWFLYRRCSFCTHALGICGFKGLGIDEKQNPYKVSISNTWMILIIGTLLSFALFSFFGWLNLRLPLSSVVLLVYLVLTAIDW